VGKVTSKLQVTVPKAIAERFGIKPGDEISWEAAGTIIHVIPASARRRGTREERLKAFDAATARQRRRQRGRRKATTPTPRGCRRDDLYERAQPR
jgi:AbrB family looped-hinge helix DNA binding protein